jgi:peptide deformylase
MAVKDILLLGNPKLYHVSRPIHKHDLKELSEVVKDLHDTLMDFKKRHGAGRAIAAPQIGVKKRLVYLYIDRPVLFINHALDQRSREMIEVWDDCMCFPDLLVRLRRHKRCRIRWLNIDWKEERMVLEGPLSELLQHECDHLEGILAVSKAMDENSFALKSQKSLLSLRQPSI